MPKCTQPSPRPRLQGLLDNLAPFQPSKSFMAFQCLFHLSCHIAATVNAELALGEAERECEEWLKGARAFAPPKPPARRTQLGGLLGM